MKPFAALLVFSAALAASAPPAFAVERAQARMIGAKGESLGTVELVETRNGVWLSGLLAPLPPGEHAFHVHAVGACDPASGFNSAAGHFALDHKHGFKTEGGPHPGDMVNLHVADGGSLMLETFNAGVSLEKGTPTSVFDTDGSALVIHAGVDDYETQPSGNAGGRIACGVIERR